MSSKIVRASWGCPLKTLVCEKNERRYAKAYPTSDEALTQQLSASCKTGALAVYGISQNNARDTNDFADRYRTTFPMLLDSEKTGNAVSNAYGITTVPTIFVIGSDSIIQQVTLGWRKPEMAALGAIRPDDSVPEWKAG
jgi:peroxiredoxin